MHTAPPQKGFTLIELSLVLVIVGLLIGAILVGRNLIHAAELQSTSKDIQHYKMAVAHFKDKYLALPGDMRNATDFWGVAAGTGSDSICKETGSQTRTCNGNGDGYIGRDAGASNFEWFRAMQHLANAGLIKGNYTGVGANSSGAQSGCILGENCPDTALNDAAIQIRSEYAANSDPNYYNRPEGNVMLLGSTNIGSVARNNPEGAAFTTEEAWNIDSKFDDGKPGTGFFLSSGKKGSAAGFAADTKDCANSALESSANYDLQRSGLSCAFRILF
jgi:prepilin-type N-terminal cleavage/methylation domain-containing protein